MRRPCGFWLTRSPRVVRSRGLLASERNARFFLSQVVLGAPDTSDPFEYLRMGFADYLRAKEGLHAFVLQGERRDPLADRLKDAAERIVAKHAGHFSGAPLGYVVLGSAYFGDPSDHPDIDLQLVHGDLPEGLYRDLRRLWNALEKIWQIKVDADVLDLPEFRRGIGAFMEYADAPLPMLSDCAIVGVYPLLGMPSWNTAALEEGWHSIGRQIDAQARDSSLFRAAALAAYDSNASTRLSKNRRARR